MTDKTTTEFAELLTAVREWAKKVMTISELIEMTDRFMRNMEADGLNDMEDIMFYGLAEGFKAQFTKLEKQFDEILKESEDIE